MIHLQKQNRLFIVALADYMFTIYNRYNMYNIVSILYICNRYDD